MEINENEYIDLVLKGAEVFQEGGKYCGSIPSLPGVYAQARSEAELLKELASVATEWIAYRKVKNLSIPLLKVEIASGQ